MAALSSAQRADRLAWTGREPRRLRFGPNLYIAQSQPGFEAIVANEIQGRIESAHAIATRRIPSRAGMVIFRASQPRRFLRLRTAEDLFALVGYHCGAGANAKWLEVARTLGRRAPLVGEGLAARVLTLPGSRAGHRLSFRVIARMAGEHEFRRSDLQRALELGIEERSDHRWHLDDGAGAVEFWASLTGEELFLALRLTDARSRPGGYKVGHMPGSLRPALAAALAWLTEPSAGDVFLDPMCGAATVLIERAHLGRYRMLLGGDHDPQALAAARENIGPRYQPIELRLWDATALPLETASVDKIAANLPWGRRLGTSADNRRLYPRLLAELQRVARPGAVVAMLTAERRLMDELARYGRFVPQRVFQVTVLGAPASIYVWRPAGRPSTQPGGRR